ncbi:hypothetical protein LWI28_008699 [Acer negundo]|uniref:Uncharacterized protein n=1 Tax=Acer negundo TaxID=4023 RepID=A0AAD5NIZ1_ACENE|nr:hypothetical protein LWI28_008699 [Acer negundo]
MVGSLGFERRDKRVSPPLRETLCSQSADKLNNSSCWNCNAVPKTASFLFCESCRSVSHFIFPWTTFKSTDWTRIMKLKMRIWKQNTEIDRKSYILISERDYAAEQSARVIEAYRTLTNPLSRAIYILKLEGVEVNEEDTVSEPELLTEIMELREAVEDDADSKALNEILSPSGLREIDTMV